MQLAAGQRCSEVCGTPSYMAPEMILGRAYGPSLDMWGAGIVLYIMLSGRHPFDDPFCPKSEVAIHAAACSGNLDIPQSCQPAEKLLRSLLALKPQARPRAASLAKHPWCATHCGKLHRTSPRSSDDAVQQAVQLGLDETMLRQSLARQEKNYLTAAHALLQQPSAA